MTAMTAMTAVAGVLGVAVLGVFLVLRVVDLGHGNTIYPLGVYAQLPRTRPTGNVTAP